LLNKLQLALILLLMISRAPGQSVQVKAGSSSLYGGYGGGIDIYLNRHVINVAGGVQSGLIQFGLTDKFSFRGMRFDAGDSSFSYSVDGSGLGVQIRGLNIKKGNLSVFGGQVGVQTMLPYFASFRPKSYGTGIFWCKKHKKLEFRHLSIYANGQKTLLSSLKYASRIFQGSTSGGLYQNHFQITGLGVLNLGHLMLAANRIQQSYQSKPLTTNAAALTFHVERFTASAAISQMKYGGTTTIGRTATASVRTADWATLQYSYYQSGKQTLHQISATQQTRLIIAQEAIDSQKHLSGNITLNTQKLTISLGRSEVLIPHRGWTSSTTVSVAVKLKDFAIRLDRLFLPDGSHKMTVSGTDWIYSDHQRENEPRFQKYLIEGTVKNAQGEAVRGAAVKIGNIICFSDKSGGFYLRVKHSKSYKVELVTDDFMMAGKIKLIKSPDHAAPGQLVEVVVEVN
jgi:hypothetical protein